MRRGERYCSKSKSKSKVSVFVVKLVTVVTVVVVVVLSSLLVSSLSLSSYSGSDLTSGVVSGTASVSSLLSSSCSMSSFPSARAYPGTALQRMCSIHARIRQLDSHQLHNNSWRSIRNMLLNAAGMKDINDVSRVGFGYTGHCFNDATHCDATPLLLSYSGNKNDRDLGIHPAIARGNDLEQSIRAASFDIVDKNKNEDESSDSSHEEGGSWCTCMHGCNMVDEHTYNINSNNSDGENGRIGVPRDVAHRQFKSMIAFKLVWCPPEYTTFVLVDDDGHLLNWGTPLQKKVNTSDNDDDFRMPSLRVRKENFLLTKGSKYAVEAERIGMEQFLKKNDTANAGSTNTADL